MNHKELSKEKLIVEDEYFVKISFKNESTYAFVSHNLILQERKQIREIMDDLLEFNIIKCLLCANRAGQKKIVTRSSV